MDTARFSFHRLGRGLARRARRMASALRHRVLVLLYHRVGATELDPWDLTVAPSHFAEHLAFLRDRVRPMSLRDLARDLREGRLPRDSVVVTFDDGYADNLTNARPVLERFETPATVFLAAGKLGNREGFWWDELSDIFLRPGTLPATLEVEVEGRAHAWELGASAVYTEEQARRERAWRGWYERMPTARHEAFVDLFPILRSVSEPHRAGVMMRLRSWAGKDAGAHPSSRILTREEAARLGQGELVEIGCHSETHSRLSALTRPEKRNEIVGGRPLLEEIAGRPVTSFAYPFGQSGDYDVESVALVRESGFTAACANMPGFVTSDGDPYELPRHYVSNWDGEEFARQWTKWHRT